MDQFLHFLVSVFFVFFYFRPIAWAAVFIYTSNLSASRLGSCQLLSSHMTMSRADSHSSDNLLCVSDLSTADAGKSLNVHLRGGG